MNLNICEEEVLKHFQQTHKHRLYKIGDVTAIMDFGNKRKNQEDSLLITNHKEISNKQLLLVADGIGGEPNGDLASNIAAIETFHWFQRLKKDILTSSQKIQAEIEPFLFYLHEIVGQKSHWGSTTLVAAIINEENIFIFNVGDSRAYIFDGTLKQVTKDHSYVQTLYDYGKIKNIDDMRFHKRSNIINNWLGGVVPNINYHFYELDKKNIQKLFLCSDGVSDCISHDEFEKIIMASDNICEDIVSHVLTYDSEITHPNYYPHYNKKIPAGKDNVSLIYKELKKK